jgi:hypothetical protein
VSTRAKRGGAIGLKYSKTTLKSFSATSTERTLLELEMFLRDGGVAHTRIQPFSDIFYGMAVLLIRKKPFEFQIGAVAVRVLAVSAGLHDGVS